MPKTKHDPNSYKGLGIKLKSKGLQKLRWFCQMCGKQCRDQNGFKCHLMSESHQRQLLLFSENPEKYVEDFSDEFEKGFMDILRRQYHTKRVHFNKVYRQYIGDKQHLHMNATKWLTLTGFVRYLAESGQCKVDDTEKGYFLTYIDKVEEQCKLQDDSKKRKLKDDDEERMQKLIQKQAERAKELAKNQPSTSYTELRIRAEKEKLEILEAIAEKDPDFVEKMAESSQKPGGNTEAQSLRKPANIFCEEETETDRKSQKRPADKGEKGKNDQPEAKKKSKSIYEEVRSMEEQRMDAKNRKPYWLHQGIIVKVITKKLGHKFYKQKGIIRKLRQMLEHHLSKFSSKREVITGFCSLHRDPSRLRRIPVQRTKTGFYLPFSTKTWIDDVAKSDIICVSSQRGSCRSFGQIHGPRGA